MIVEKKNAEHNLCILWIIYITDYNEESMRKRCGKQMDLYMKSL